MRGDQRLLRLLPPNRFLAAAYGAAVEIPKDAAAGEQGKLVWIQAAYEGDFKGYRFPMSLTKATFASFIKNLHADPQFKAGPDGFGTQPVVRMDYEHASAMPPSEGSIPAQGAPAPGWVCDLALRDGKGGRVELWALCDLGDQLREQIKSGEYRFTSIDAPLKAKDPVTGVELGPKLDALAVTNSPFLRDLEPMRIAASMAVSQYGKAETGDEFLVGLRQILEVEEETTPADMAKLVEQLGTAFEADMRPPGYPEGLGCVIASLRQLLGLPLLSTADSIISAAGQQLAALSASTTSTPLPPVTTTPEEPMATPNTSSTMSDKLRGALVALFGCIDHDDAILAAANKATGAEATLAEMMKTFGAKDAKDLADKASAARDHAAKAAEFGGKWAELLATLDGNAQEEQKQETEQVAASLGFQSGDPRGVAARSIIMSQGLAARRAALGIEVTADGKITLGAKDDSKFKTYREQYPLPNAERAKAALLTTPIVAGPNGLQLGGNHTGLTGPSNGAPGAGAVPPHIAVLSDYSGPNDVAKAIAYLDDKQPGFVKLSMHEKNYLAGRYLATGKAA